MLSSKLKNINYDSKDNKEITIKYEGYMMIQKRKNNLAPEQYLDSNYLKDLMSGKQLNSEAI